MPLFRRMPHLLPIPGPRLDGSSWPDRRQVGRGSFAASTMYAMAQQEAFTPAAHGVTDLLLEQILPMVDTGAAPEDEAHMRTVCISAAQLGAGTGLVEQRVVQPQVGTDRDIGGVLWLAAESLPPMPRHQQDVARYFLQCGYYLARMGPNALPTLVAELMAESHPAVRRRS